MRSKTSILQVFFSALIFCTSTLIAQKAEAPDYKYNIGSIKWMQMTDTGTLLASTNKGIYGIKPNTSEPSFLFDKRKNIKQENFNILPETPYAMFIANGMNGVTFVIDIISGKTLFDSKGEGFSFIHSRNIILPENKLVVSGLRKVKGKIGVITSVAIFNLSTGKEEYTISLKGNNNVVGVPDIVNNKLLLPRKKGLDFIDLSSGNTIWTADLKNIESINIQDDAIYAFQNDNNKKNHTIHKITLSGKIAWKEGNKLKGKAATVEFINNGIAILAHKNKKVQTNKGKFAGAKFIEVPEKSYIYFLDKNTGADLWNKAPKLKSVVTHFYALEDGILYGQSEGGINKVKYNGTPLWKKPLKTGAGIITLAKTEKGLLYITGKDADIVDQNTGASVLGKKLKYKQSKTVTSLYDRNNKRYLLSCSDGLYSIDVNIGKAKMIAKPKFEGKEMPSKIEIRNNNILLTSSQNMMLLESNGKEIYNEFYKAPGTSTFGKILSGAVALTSVALAAGSAVRAGANKSSSGRYNSYGSQMDHNSKGFSKIAGASFGAMSKRYKASAQTQDDKFILSKLKSGVGLVKLNKDDGKKIKEILLKDKKPTYKIDPIERILYYQANKTTIYAYKI